MSLGNVMVGQSGGPTSVINSSLVGVFKTAKDAGCGKIFGMRNGIEGLLKERYVNLSDYVKNDLDIELLKRTPSSFLGTCRYKLPSVEDQPEVYERLFHILNKLDFFALEPVICLLELLRRDLISLEGRIDLLEGEIAALLAAL